jgi:Mn2+/Fe2+ NRAMP family transporter
VGAGLCQCAAHRPDGSPSVSALDALAGPARVVSAGILYLALVCFPIWVCFHAGTLGTFLSWLAGTEGAWHGGAYYLWGIVILAGVLVLSFAGGYQALERIQLLIVLLMLMSVAVALFFIHPDWLEFAKGLFAPASGGG